ncbi:hypothetical protein YC2023_055436 [Brassica napus]
MKAEMANKEDDRYHFIPITRSKSPKLGRRKSSGGATGGETSPRWVWSLMDMVPNGHGHSLSTNNKWINGYGLMDCGLTQFTALVETQEKSGKAEERRKEVKKEEAKKKRRLRS